MNNQEMSEDDAASTTLTKAVVRAAELLQIGPQSLAKIVGTRDADVARLFAGEYRLSRERRDEWNRATQFVRLYRSLNSVFGQDPTARKWLEGTNTALNDKPMNMIQSVDGLAKVLDYLDAHRGV
jgi:putative toxin-antitoxin system antitoxin component (TIGR02293 family)